MANGLYCSETLPSTPKLRHDSTDSNDSNSENTPPELLSVVGKHSDLFCHEVLDSAEDSRLNPTPSQKSSQNVPQPYPRHHQESFNHLPVHSKTDLYLLNDDRVLQNLLRNEERYMPTTPDYFKYVQKEIKEDMRQKVVEWMYNVSIANQESNLPIDAFALAVNFLDRFLAVCRIGVNQFQLLGASCLFLASKFKAIDSIRSIEVVDYTDHAYTVRELKDWELLILQKLLWELSSTTALDYLDHVIPRLFLPQAVDETNLRRSTNTIICLALQDYYFTYKPPSLLAAASILVSLQQCFAANVAAGQLSDQQLQAVERIIKEARTCLQILTHAAGDDLDACCQRLQQSTTLPEPANLPVSPEQRSPDTTSSKRWTSTPAKVQTSSDASFSAAISSTTSLPLASDVFSDASSAVDAFSDASLTSAVDVFTDFNSSVLEAVLSPNNDSYSSLQFSSQSLVT